MHIQRLAILLLMVTAAQANAIQKSIQHPKEIKQQVQPEQTKISNEVPVLVEQGNSIVKQELPISQTVSSAARPQKLNPKPQSNLISEETAPVERKPTNTAIKTEQPAAKVPEKQPNVSVKDEVGVLPSVAEKAAPVERKPTNTAIKTAQPAVKEQEKQPNVNAKDQHKLPNNIPVAPAGTVGALPPVASVPLTDVVASSVAAKLPVVPAAPVAVKAPDAPKANAAAAIHEQPAAPVVVKTSAALNSHVAPAVPKQQLTNAIPKLEVMVAVAPEAPTSLVVDAAPVALKVDDASIIPVVEEQKKLNNVFSKGQASHVASGVTAGLVAKEQQKLPSVISSKLASPVVFVSKDQQKDSSVVPTQVAKETLTHDKHEEQLVLKGEQKQIQGEKFENTDQKVVSQTGAEARVGFLDSFYIIDDSTLSNDSDSNTSNDTSSSTHKHTHTHEHIYYKPALFPLPPPPFVSFVSDSASSSSNGYGNKYGNSNKYTNTSDNTNYYYNKYGSSSSGNKYGSSSSGSKPGYFPLPLLPIPFWKPGSVFSSNEKYNTTSSSDDPFYNYKPNYFEIPSFYINEKRAHEDAGSFGNQQGLVLIGHIFLHIKPQSGNGQTADFSSGNTASNSLLDNDKTKPTTGNVVKDDSSAKIEEPLHNSQLLLQPLVYPTNNENSEGNTNPLPNQINEIYRSLHLVHPTTQQRSQSPDVSEEGAVLFAVEIPKPIYRFFKSVFGVFSY
ncbi:uncharacterized protein LOC133846302 isoform X1 [Drosophila sulfurigaster albostrigata]|uniref:uncharacterized protein LOC133846302 isoform X1 n=1 Tax=Drosophila sulfurigaster albostrigata TaxID=89887 RepID=UPI002D21B6EB|nr:uncharacterized protein LOC133846302 isoform X1 [Drosophila sulfurigaster albostrigata]